MPPIDQLSPTRQQFVSQTSQTGTASHAAKNGELPSLAGEHRPSHTSPLLAPSNAQQLDLPVFDAPNPYNPATSDSIPSPRRHSFTRKLLRLHDESSDFGSPSAMRKRSVSGRRKVHAGHGLDDPRKALRTHNGTEQRRGDVGPSTSKPGLGPRPVGGHGKLGTFSGVFVPTFLNILSILMFLRFGFILGQAGVVGMMGEIGSFAMLCS
jgi:hypothetical protein